MAWYAIYKWCRPWRKAPLFDFIEWYSWEIKTPEERERILLQEERERKEALKKINELMLFAHVITDALPDDGYYKPYAISELRKMDELLYG